jgi:hypothetical protein
MKYDFYLKQGDTWPPLKARLLQADCTDIPISTAHSIKFTMTKFRNRNDVIIDKGDVTIEEIEGKDWAVYTWQPADTDTAGAYQAEFVIDLGSGNVVTVPNENDKYIYILIGNQLGTSGS